MKKLILTAVAVMAFGFMNAQDTKFGVKAGYDSGYTISKFDFGGTAISATASQGGFFIGGFADVAVSEKFHVQPELLYASVKDFGQIQIPILAKFQVAEGFNILAGPELAILTTKSDYTKSFNYGLDLGASYDFTENIFADVAYNFGLANLLKDATNGESVKAGNFRVGIGYKF
jgi:opacity protein-like surface antigen